MGLVRGVIRGLTPTARLVRLAYGYCLAGLDRFALLVAEDDRIAGQVAARPVQNGERLFELGASEVLWVCFHGPAREPPTRTTAICDIISVLTFAVKVKPVNNLEPCVPGERRPGCHDGR